MNAGLKRRLVATASSPSSAPGSSPCPRSLAPTRLARRPKAAVHDTSWPSSWIVTLEPEVDRPRSGRGPRQGGRRPGGHVYQHALNGFVFKGSAKAAAALRREPERPDGRRRPAGVASSPRRIPPGIGRIRARHPDPARRARLRVHRAPACGSRSSTPAIDLTHPDLVANLDTGLGLNCMNTAVPPQDGHGHGTHVAGIVGRGRGQRHRRRRRRAVGAARAVQGPRRHRAPASGRTSSARSTT